jgi:hypothetical protein
VEGHLNHVFEKLGVLSRTEIVHYALATGNFVRDGSTNGAAAARGAGDAGAPVARATAEPPG